MRTARSARRIDGRTKPFHRGHRIDVVTTVAQWWSISWHGIRNYLPLPTLHLKLYQVRHKCGTVGRSRYSHTLPLSSNDVHHFRLVLHSTQPKGRDFASWEDPGLYMNCPSSSTEVSCWLIFADYPAFKSVQ